MKYLLIILLLCFLIVSSQAQDTDTIDSVKAQHTDSLGSDKAEKVYIPKRALIYSLIIPGGGQIYNRKYWKLPIVYGGYIGTISSIKFNRKEYDRFNTAYKQRLANIPDPFIGILRTADDIRQIRDGYRANLELSYFGLGLVYLLVAADSYVDAHLNSMDLDENLHIGLVSPEPGDAHSMGVGIVYRG